MDRQESLGRAQLCEENRKREELERKLVEFEVNSRCKSEAKELKSKVKRIDAF